MVVSGGNAVYIVGTFKHLGIDADFKVPMFYKLLVLIKKYPAY